MEKNVRLYQQKGMTCSIACMLMALEYFKCIEKANSKLEKYYYNKYSSNYLEGTPFSAIAMILAKNNLETEIFHSEINYFKNDKSIMAPRFFEMAMNEYKRYLMGAKNNGVQIKKGIDVNTDLLKLKLEEDNLLIVAGQQSNYLHAVLICGYKDDKFIVCDPLLKEKQIKTSNEINKFMNTYLGKWFISVKVKDMN